MDCCWERYLQPGGYRPTTDILNRPDRQTGSRNVAHALEISISGFILDVLANLHNKVMHSQETPVWKKIATVILLDVAALALCFLALIEGVVRLVLGILLLPILPFFCKYQENIVYPAATGLFTLGQIPNALYSAFQFSTAKTNVIPWHPKPENCPFCC